MPPPRPPDFETPDIERHVEVVIAKYARQFFIACIVAAFLFGGWMTMLTLQLNGLDKRRDVADQHEWMLTDHEKRITRLERTP